MAETVIKQITATGPTVSFRLVLNKGLQTPRRFRSLCQMRVSGRFSGFSQVV